jgi:spermidine/putrescine transport system permease protein
MSGELRKGRKGRLNYGTIYTLPIVVWFTVFFLVPLLVIVLFSFLEADIDGGVLPRFTAAAFAGLWKPRILKLFVNTVWVSLASTALTIAMALPCAYYMARSRNKTLLLILVIVPFWTNFIIRIFAWKSILEANGVVNSALVGLGLVANPLQLEHNWIAVIVINVYTYLTYAILPLFSTIEKFDFTLLEAARDLGATKMQAIFRVLLPNVRAGIVTAVFFTFIPLLGSFVVQQLIGTKDMYMLGNEINDNIYKYFDWPTAYALAVVLMLLANAGLLFVMRSDRRQAKVQAARRVDDPDGLSPDQSGRKAGASGTMVALGAGAGGAE